MSGELSASPAPRSRPRRSKHTPAAKGGKWLYPATRWAIYLRDGFACVYCGATGALSVDHVRSVEREGRRDNRPANLVTCCVSCNSSKQGLSARAWYVRLRERGLDTKAIRSRIARTVRRPLDRARAAELLASARAERCAA